MASQNTLDKTYIHIQRGHKHFLTYFTCYGSIPPHCAGAPMVSLLKILYTVVVWPCHPKKPAWSKTTRIMNYQNRQTKSTKHQNHQNHGKNTIKPTQKPRNNFKRTRSGRTLPPTSRAFAQGRVHGSPPGSGGFAESRSKHPRGEPGCRCLKTVFSRVWGSFWGLMTFLLQFFLKIFFLKDLNNLCHVFATF